MTASSQAMSPVPTIASPVEGSKRERDPGGDGAEADRRRRLRSAPCGRRASNAAPASAAAATMTPTAKTISNADFERHASIVKRLLR